MKVYTRTGDDGTTGLFGGDRVTKSHPRIAAYGTVDETNAVLGLARAHLASLPSEGSGELGDLLGRLQEELFVCGGDLASPHDTKYPVPRIEQRHVDQLERDIDRLEEDLPPLKHFILPTGHPAAAALHLARTVARRAERLVVELAALEPVNTPAATYLNRLSDLLFVMARAANAAEGVAETAWIPVERGADG
jgi:cob(I)alamin adenosyltransferase